MAVNSQISDVYVSDVQALQWKWKSRNSNSVALQLTNTQFQLITSSSVLFIQQQNSTNTVTNVDTNEVETGMIRLIALTVTPVY